MNHEETVSFGQAALKLTFDPGSPDDGLLTAECRLDHPFFVKNKGERQQQRLKKKFFFNIFWGSYKQPFKQLMCSIFVFQVGLHFIQALL